MLNAYLLNDASLNGAVTGEQPAGLAQRGTDVIWQARTLDTNFVVVYGEAVDGSLVSGQAYDSDEVQKVGYRLDIVTEPAISTAALCQSVAEAVVQKMRLNKASGALTALPNCGLELFDVIEITDRWSNLSQSRFRVTGIGFSYRSEGGAIKQALELGAA